MRVVLDTNVLISGIFFKGPPYQILKAWEQKKFELAISPKILEEYERVGKELGKKFPKIDLQPLLNFITIRSVIVSDQELSEPVSKDPDAEKFIACALFSKSKMIISGDQDLLKVSGLPLH